MLIQVSTEKNDSFHEVDEDDLRCIYKLPLGERKEAFAKVSKAAVVHSTDDVELVLVMNGHEDGESWDEMAEQFGILRGPS